MYQYLNATSFVIIVYNIILNFKRSVFTFKIFLYIVRINQSVSFCNCIQIWIPYFPFSFQLTSTFKRYQIIMEKYTECVRRRTQIHIVFLYWGFFFGSIWFLCALSIGLLYLPHCCFTWLFHLYKRLYTIFDNKNRRQSQRKCHNMWHCQHVPPPPPPKKLKVLYGLELSIGMKT